jgi:hypothetical protein
MTLKAVHWVPLTPFVNEVLDGKTGPIRHCEEGASPTRQSREMIEIASLPPTLRSGLRLTAMTLNAVH